MTRRSAASAGMTGRQLAAAVTPGPDPCSSSTGGAAVPTGAPVSMTAVRTPATASLRSGRAALVTRPGPQPSPAYARLCPAVLYPAGRDRARLDPARPDPTGL